MTKRPSFPNSIPGATNPTVGLPGAGGNMRATVQIPGLKPAAPVAPQGPTSQGAPSQEEIAQALRQGGRLFAAKKFDEAEEIARLVLKFAPRNADGMHLLGLVLQAKGNPAEGERLMVKALKIAGSHPVLLVNLGNAARAQGKIAKALKYYDQAEKLFPFHDDTYLERGILYVDSRRLLEALENFEHLIDSGSDSLAAYSGAAHAASELGQFQRAIDYCEKVKEKFPEAPVEILAMIAISYERLSKLPEAIEAAAHVFAIDPDHCPTLRAWAKAKRRLAKRDPEILASLKQRLEEVDLKKQTKADARVIFSELANICEDLGDVDAAFAYFQKQNDIMILAAEEAGADTTTYFANVIGMIEKFSPEYLDKLNSSLSNERIEGELTPAFIVGFPRSGTTLLDQIFDAHPDIRVIEEQPMIRKVFDAASALPGGYDKALSNLKEGQRKKLQDVYWTEARRRVTLDKPVIVDKLPLSIIHMPLIKTVFPNAKIILALRHPADCSLSCFMQDFEPNSAMLNFTSLEGTANLYDLVMTLWERYEAHLSLNVRRVHYEKLIVDLRGEVEPVLNFLGLEWNEAMADPAAHARARGTIRTPSYAQVTQPIYGTSADRWRRYEKHLAPILPKLEKHIRYFGYSL